MIKKISKSLIDLLLKSDCGEKENSEIYLYGLEILLSTILNIIIILVVGFLFNMIVESILFFVSFAIIRTYSGGYHAQTYFKCNLIIFLNIILVMLFISALALNYFLSVFIGVIGISFLFSMVLLFAPVENKNKALSIEKIKKFKIISIISTLVLFLIWLILLKNNISFSLALTASNLTTAISIVVEILLIKRRTKL